MKTTLAIAVWDNCVATTFDFARKLLVVEVSGAREVARQELFLGDEPGAPTVKRLRDMGVAVLICGAISRPLAQAVGQAGIQAIPFVAGPIDDVLAAYLCGRLGEPCFLQPGCASAARRRWRHQSGHCGRHQRARTRRWHNKP